MRKRIESATAAVIDVLERYDLTISETNALLNRVARRYEAITKTVKVKDFKGYQIDVHGEVIKPTQEAGAVYEVTTAEIEKALNDAEARHSGPAYGEKTTGSDVADQNRLEKSYTCILPHGGCVKIDISATAESIGEDMFPALSEIGIATKDFYLEDFYLEFGREINGKTTEQGVPE